MQGHKANIVSQALTYIEANLEEQLELDIVADALHYSRFYLHRLFAEMAGLRGQRRSLCFQGRR